MLVAALAAIAVIPIESFNAREVDHRYMTIIYKGFNAGNIRCSSHVHRSGLYPLDQIGTAIASNALSQLMRSTRFCTMRKASPSRRSR